MPVPTFIRDSVCRASWHERERLEELPLAHFGLGTRFDSDHDVALRVYFSRLLGAYISSIIHIYIRKVTQRVTFTLLCSPKSFRLRSAQLSTT